MMMQRLNKPVWWLTGGAIAVGLVLVVLLVALRPRSPLPSDIQKQLDFVVLYPAKATGYVIDPATVAYSASTQVVTFSAAVSGTKLVFSEQATPSVFSDAPGYFAKLTEKLHDYDDFDSTLGHVALTRPDELHGGQSAVMNSSGTLMFIHPNHDLSADAWRKLFNGLQVSK
jgi:hypothetical protein